MFKSPWYTWMDYIGSHSARKVSSPKEKRNFILKLIQLEQIGQKESFI